MSIFPGGGQVMQASPFVIELNGAVAVRRDGSNRILEVIHPSGVLMGRITLDAINAISIARQLGSSPEPVTNGTET
jgi:hypothetical protein